MSRSPSEIRVASSGYFGQPNVVSLQSDKKQLAEALDRALGAMRGWTPDRRLRYKVTLGIKNRNAEFTRDFGGEAAPEPDSVAALAIPSTASPPMVKLLYLLRHGDDVSLDAPTARSLTGRPDIADLIHILKEAEDARLVRRTAPEPRELVEADRDSIVGLTLTDQGRRYLEDALRDTRAPAPRAAAQ